MITAHLRRPAAVGTKAAQTMLEGRGAYGSGQDDLLRLVADLTAPPGPAELRGEAEALLAFRAGRAYLAQGTPRHRVAVPVVPPARRAAPVSTGLPVIGSVFAVAASAAIGVLAWTAAVPGAPTWTVDGPGVPAQPASRQISGSGTANGGAAAASAGGGMTQPRSGAAGAGRGSTRSGTGATGSAMVATPSGDAGGGTSVMVAGVDHSLPVTSPTPSGTSTTAPAGGVSEVPGGGGTDHVPNPSPTRAEANGGTIGGGSTVNVPVASPVVTVSPTTVAGASTAASPVPSSSGPVQIASSWTPLPKSMKGVCTAWRAQGGSHGRNADEPKFFQLLALEHGSKSNVDTACERL